MPITDAIGRFLQSDEFQNFARTAFLKPAQQAQYYQQQEAMGAAQAQEEQRQKEFQQQLEQQLNIAKARETAEGLRYGLSVGLNGGPATQQGGPGFNATEPTLGEAPGAPTPRGGSPAGPSNDEIMDKLVPGWNQMFGMQQQGGQGVNVAGSIPSGVSSVGNRMLPSGASSAGGGVVSPALGTNALGQSVGLLPQPTEKQIKLPQKAVEAGLPATLPSSEFWKNFANLEKYFGPAPAGKAGKTSETDDLQQSAAQMVGKAHNLTGTFNRIGDLPLENQEEAWNKLSDLKGGEEAKKIKDQRIAEMKDRADRLATQKASDGETLDEIRRDPQAWFELKDKDQQARIRVAAKEQGINIPTRQIPKQGQMADSLLAADTVQASIARMKQIAEALGPQSFGAMVGRVKNAEGEWGSPIFTDPLRAQLEQEFRSHATLLSAQEAKLVGGGRASVMLWNALKSATPQQRMDYNSILQGAFRASFNRAQMTKNSIRRWANGEIENPYTQYSGFKKGDVVTLKDGRKVRLLGGPDEKGNINQYEEVK